MKHPNREAWLNHVAGELAPIFARLGSPLPAQVRIAIGFTSTGRRGKAIGECWDSRCSEDGHFEVLIRPDLAEEAGAYAMQVAAVLAHELVHAAVGIPAGHGPAFRAVAQGLGLQGPMRATTASQAFEAMMQPILKAAGPLPHGRLLGRIEGAGEDDTTRPKKQGNRHVKCLCADCGYTVRTARKWLDEVGPPHCPRHGPMVADTSPAEGEEAGTEAEGTA